MTTHTIHATPQEVEALLAEPRRLTTFWRPVTPSPPAGAHPIYDELDCYEGRGWAFQYPHDCGHGITYNRIFSLPKKGRCPFGQPGDMLAIKETWREHEGRGQQIPCLYKADYPDLNVAWRSPVTLSRDLVRPGFIRPIVGVQIKRVQSVTAADVEAAGIDVACKLPAFVPPGTDMERLDALATAVARKQFEREWQSRYGTWAENPPAWGITIGEPQAAAEAAEEVPSDEPN